LDPNIIKSNLEAVEERIERAASRAGRKRGEITLVAVTKVFPVEIILNAHAAGLRQFGENFVQEFERKKPAVAGLEGARVHLIGHLQSNKARRAAELFDVIQTVDTPKLARRLNGYSRDLEVMIEVKLSGEESKRGAAPDDVPQLIDAVRACENLNLTGLMTMPPWSIDPELARGYFIRLRAIAERHALKNLSMGMSNDFEVAIEEGATHIRVGSALFGPRPKKK
jgi:PLP dependent protein